MTAKSPAQTAPVKLSKPAPIRLKLDLVDRLCAGQGAKTDSERGRLLQIDQSLVGRVRRGEVAPGLTFLARVFHAFPEWPWHELCELDQDNAGLIAEAS